LTTLVLDLTFCVLSLETAGIRFISSVVSRVWLINVCVCAGVVSVVGLITDITSAVSAVPDKRAVCVVRPSSYGVNCGGGNDPLSDREGGWSSANLGTQ